MTNKHFQEYQFIITIYDKVQSLITVIFARRKMVYCHDFMNEFGSRSSSTSWWLKIWRRPNGSTASSFQATNANQRFELATLEEKCLELDSIYRCLLHASADEKTKLLIFVLNLKVNDLVLIFNTSIVKQKNNNATQVLDNYHANIVSKFENWNNIFKLRSRTTRYIQ